MASDALQCALTVKLPTLPTLYFCLQLGYAVTRKCISCIGVDIKSDAGEGRKSTLGVPDSIVAQRLISYTRYTPSCHLFSFFSLLLARSLIPAAAYSTRSVGGDGRERWKDAYSAQIAADSHA